MRFRGLGGNSLNKHAFLILISESPACEVLYRAKPGVLTETRKYCETMKCRAGLKCFFQHDELFGPVFFFESAL